MAAGVPPPVPMAAHYARAVPTPPGSAADSLGSGVSSMTLVEGMPGLPPGANGYGRPLTAAEARNQALLRSNSFQ